MHITKPTHPVYQLNARQEIRTKSQLQSSNLKPRGFGSHTGGGGALSVELTKQAVRDQQLFRSATLNNPPTLDNHHLVKVDNGVEAMDNGNHRTSCEGRADETLHESIRFRVDAVKGSITSDTKESR